MTRLHGKANSQSSLVDLCRSVIVINLERYPPDALGILDEDEWDNIVHVRYETTKPQKGKGGLDGKGRVNPAIGEKFMFELETTIPLLTQSKIVDELVWKDIVEFKFRTGGVSRPRWLLYPWPVLQQVVKDYEKTLARVTQMDVLDGDTRELCIRTIQGVCELPMDVPLLNSSGIGRTVTKFIKACSVGTRCLHVFCEPMTSSNAKDTPCARLEGTVQAWKQMAASGGVQIKDLVESPSIDTCSFSMSKTRTCMSWRDLLEALDSYDMVRKSSQGARMRERRQMLDKVRPKVVKVRQASSRQEAIISRQGLSTKPCPAKRRIQKLRMEASISSMRRGGPTNPVATTAFPGSTASSATRVGFGAAVASATGQRGRPSSNNMHQGSKKGSLLHVKGVRQMLIPDSKKGGTSLHRPSK